MSEQDRIAIVCAVLWRIAGTFGPPLLTGFTVFAFCDLAARAIGAWTNPRR